MAKRIKIHNEDRIMLKAVDSNYFITINLEGHTDTEYRFIITNAHTDFHLIIENELTDAPELPAFDKLVRMYITNWDKTERGCSTLISLEDFNDVNNVLDAVGRLLKDYEAVRIAKSILSKN